MKELQYITHDMGARNDPKLLNVQMRMGGAGLAIFWCIVEMLWENDGYLPTDYEAIAFALRRAKPADVKRVVTEFDLFVVEDGRFWSRSAMARIPQKKERLTTRENSARTAANARWQKSGNASAMQSQCETHTDAMPRYIDRYIDKKKDNNNTPLTAADFFEIFFFGNVKDPGGEAQRFVNYYEERGWQFQDGTPVTDPIRAAKDWKPLKAGKRWDDEALRWYRAVWNAAKERVEDAQDAFICQLTNIRRKDQQLALVFRTPGAARKVSSFITENDLAGDYTIDYRIES